MTLSRARSPQWIPRERDGEREKRERAKQSKGFLLPCPSFTHRSTAQSVCWYSTCYFSLKDYMGHALAVFFTHIHSTVELIVLYLFCEHCTCFCTAQNSICFIRGHHSSPSSLVVNLQQDRYGMNAGRQMTVLKLDFSPLSPAEEAPWQPWQGKSLSGP